VKSAHLELACHFRTIQAEFVDAGAHKVRVGEFSILPAGIIAPTFLQLHHHCFRRQQLAVTWDQRPDRRTRRAFLQLSYSYATAVWTGLTRDTTTRSGHCQSACSRGVARVRSRWLRIGATSAASSRATSYAETKRNNGRCRLSKTSPGRDAPARQAIDPSGCGMTTRSTPR
jgi:hypothetical protein